MLLESTTPIQPRDEIIDCNDLVYEPKEYQAPTRCNIMKYNSDTIIESS